MAKLDLRKIYMDGKPERNRFLDEAQLIAELTIASLEPRPSGSDGQLGANSGPRAIRRPKSNAGAAAVKGLVSTVIASNAPPNVRFFRLTTDPVLGMSEQQKQQLEQPFGQFEDQIERFLARHSFHAFQHPTLERVFVEGTGVVKVDKDKGFIQYPLRQCVISRNFGKVVSITLEEFCYCQSKTGDKPERKTQYIHVDKLNNQVYFQDDESEYGKLTDDLAEAYCVVGTEIPYIDNYARSYYADHYGLLKTIDASATALLDAQKLASWNVITYTGPTSIPTSRIAGLKPLEVFRTVSHDAIKVQSSGAKINDWEFIYNKLQNDESKLLSLSAVGLSQRAASVQTATEVMAIKAELDSLIGSASQVISETFYHQIIDACLDVLGIRQQFAQAVMQTINLPPDQLPPELADSKLIEVVGTTGAPALAREADLTRLLNYFKIVSSIIGPQALAGFVNGPNLMKEIANGLRVHTDGVINTQPQVDPNPGNNPNG